MLLLLLPVLPSALFQLAAGGGERKEGQMRREEGTKNRTITNNIKQDQGASTQQSFCNLLY